MMAHLPISMWCVRLLIIQRLVHNDKQVECFRIIDCKPNVKALDNMPETLINLTMICTASTATSHCKISELKHNGSSICCPAINESRMYTEEISPCNKEDNHCSISNFGTPKLKHNRCEFAVYNVDIRGTFNTRFYKNFPFLQ